PRLPLEPPGGGRRVAEDEPVAGVGELHGLAQQVGETDTLLDYAIRRQHAGVPIPETGGEARPPVGAAVHLSPADPIDAHNASLVTKVPKPMNGGRSPRSGSTQPPHMLATPTRCRARARRS